jgi:hypothetical protein
VLSEVSLAERNTIHRHFGLVRLDAGARGEQSILSNHTCSAQAAGSRLQLSETVGIYPCDERVHPNLVLALYDCEAVVGHCMLRALLVCPLDRMACIAHFAVGGRLALTNHPHPLDWFRCALCTVKIQTRVV